MDRRQRQSEAQRGSRALAWRSAMAAGMLAATLAAGTIGTTGTAGAEGCGVAGVVGCPAPEPEPSPPTVPSTTTSTTSTTVPAEPSPAEARAHLADLVNAERTTRGIPPLAPRDDVTDIAQPWSGSMANAGQLSHNDAFFSDDTRQRLDARLLGENVARAGTIDQAHRALMASEHHRANILDARFSVVGYGAIFRDGSWWVTQDFVQTRAAATPAPTPAPAPTVRASTPGTTAAPRRAAAGTGATVNVSAASASDKAAPVAATKQLSLVPTTVNPPAMSNLAGEAAPSGGTRLTTVAVVLLLATSVAALHRARARATRLTAAQ